MIWAHALAGLTLQIGSNPTHGDTPDRLVDERTFQPHTDACGCGYRVESRQASTDYQKSPFYAREYWESV